MYKTEKIPNISFRSSLSFFSMNIDNPNEERTAIEKVVIISMRLGKNVGSKGSGSWKNHLVKGESRVRKKEKKAEKVKKPIRGFIFLLKIAYPKKINGTSPA